jgi:hypothetical protein
MKLLQAAERSPLGVAQRHDGKVLLCKPDSGNVFVVDGQHFRVRPISDADALSEDWMPCTAEEVRRKFTKRERRKFNGTTTAFQEDSGSQEG